MAPSPTHSHTSPAPPSRRHDPAVYRRRRLGALLVLLLTAAGLWWAATTAGLVPGLGTQDDDGAAESAAAEPAETDDEAAATGSPVGDPAQQSADPAPQSRETLLLEPSGLFPRASDPSWDPDSIHVLVNSLNPLEPLDHEPEDLMIPDVQAVREGQQLREEAAGALEELFAAAEAQGYQLTLTSAYRPFERQAQLYDQRAAEWGQEAADEYTARPGHSEHQTGLAADVIAHDNPECGLGECFAETSEGVWTAEHAAEFGFVIRYPEGAEDITGYSYEPWHLRYVGEETASAVAEQEVTLEEFWDQPPASDYEEG